MLAALLGLTAVWVATGPSGLSAESVARLTVMDDRIVNGIIARQVAEAVGGVVVGGSEGSSGRFLIMLLNTPAATTQVLPSPAAPYFAVSPNGDAVAYWRSVPAEDPVPMAELVTVEVASGVARSLCGPMMLSGSGRLVWPLPGNIVFAVSRPLPDGQFGVLWRLDVGTGRVVCLLKRMHPSGVGKVYAGDSPDTVVFVDEGEALAVPITGAEHSPTDLWAALYPRPGGRAWLVLEPRVTLRGEGAGPALRFAGTDAAWAPDGTACLIAAGGKLFAAPADLAFARKLLGWHGAPREFTCPLWRQTLGDAVVGVWGPAPALHLFSLATETVEVSVAFATSRTPPAGAKVWVARDFLFDATGTPLKPNWATLKACLVVRSSAPQADGVVLQCVNCGLEPGVVERLTAPGAQQTEFSEIVTARAGKKTVWLRRWKVEARRDLRAWVEGLPVWGSLDKISVELRRIDAP